MWEEVSRGEALLQLQRGSQPFSTWKYWIDLWNVCEIVTHFTLSCLIFKHSHFAFADFRKIPLWKMNILIFEVFYVFYFKIHSYSHILLNCSHWVVWWEVETFGWESLSEVLGVACKGPLLGAAPGISVLLCMGCGSWGPWCLDIGASSRDLETPPEPVNANQSFYVFRSGHLCSLSPKGTYSV